MIKTPTTFVLGAGASASYDFPTAPELTRRVIDGLASEGGQFWTHFTDAGVPASDLRAFRSSLDRSRIRSIDRFLEIREADKDLVVLGKRAIAYVLIRHENPDYAWQSSPDDWMGLLWNAMVTPTMEGLAANRVSFVTFNYDRSLEQYLVEAVRHTYDVTDMVAAQQVSRIPIAHVHGVLGGRPGIVYPQANNLPVRPYSQTPSPDHVALAADQIRLVGEERSEANFSAAQALIDAAQRVVFLGFAYDPSNVQRLKAAEHWNYRVNTFRTRLQGSGFGLAGAEREAACRLFARHLQPAHANWKCLEFLRHEVDLTI